MERAERKQRRRRMDQDRPILANGLAVILTGETHFGLAEDRKCLAQVQSAQLPPSDIPTPDA
jgi:hypothetical protein